MIAGDGGSCLNRGRAVDGFHHGFVVTDLATDAVVDAVCSPN